MKEASDMLDSLETLPLSRSTAKDDAEKLYDSVQSMP